MAEHDHDTPQGLHVHLDLSELESLDSDLDLDPEHDSGSHVSLYYSIPSSIDVAMTPSPSINHDSWVTNVQGLKQRPPIPPPNA